ncbi:MAG: PEP-CTERM sorting domain-containing protein [Rubrivivax sp.]|nr:PEP-CTERM sorting domain-containing protein [Rubrivivax sp.]
MNKRIQHGLAALGLFSSLGAQAAWQTHGDAVDLGGSLTLTTAYSAPGDPDTAFNLSGIAAVDIGVVEALAGLPAYALDLGDEAGTEGSLAGQSFNVAAGDTLSFNWAFSSQDADFLDHAFVVLGGQLSTLATTAQPGSAQNSFSHTFTGAGLVTLALGVVDTTDYLGVSTLNISALQISPVPEPASALLWLAGLAAFMTRRRVATAARNS